MDAARSMRAVTDSLSRSLKKGLRNRKALAWAQGTSRRASEWAGENEYVQLGSPQPATSFFSILLGFAGGGQGLIDFSDEAPFNFRNLLCAHAQNSSPLCQLLILGLDAESGDIRGEGMKRHDVLIP